MLDVPLQFLNSAYCEEFIDVKRKGKQLHWEGEKTREMKRRNQKETKQNKQKKRLLQKINRHPPKTVLVYKIISDGHIDAANIFRLIYVPRRKQDLKPCKIWGFSCSRGKINKAR